MDLVLWESCTEWADSGDERQVFQACGASLGSGTHTQHNLISGASGTHRTRIGALRASREPKFEPQLAALGTKASCLQLPHAQPTSSPGNTRSAHRVGGTGRSDGTWEAEKEENPFGAKSSV